MASVASSSIFRSFQTATLAIIPVFFVKEKLFSLYRVEGSSMEPALYHGDVILVRKADIYPHAQWRKWTSSTPANSYEEELENENALRVIAQDAECGRPIGSFLTAYTYLNPPTIHQLGSVIVFRAPDAEKYPMSEYRVKRVIGLGGQLVRPGDSFRELKKVPPFSLWVEGDNNGNIESKKNNVAEAKGDLTSTKDDSGASRKENNSTPPKISSNLSVDSRTYGPISKNLIIGVAERIVWPPSRWGPIQKITNPVPRSWWPGF